MATMMAVRVHQFGDPGVLRLEEVPRPEAGDAEVLVRVMAAAVNPIDWKLRSGQSRGGQVPLPWTPGGDFSGVVEAVGKGVTGFGKGDEVFGRAAGSYAEYVLAAPSSMAIKPPSLDHVKAGCIAIAGLTAWQALFGRPGAPSLELAPDQSLMILGAAGGVGGFAVQLARWKGAHVVAVYRGPWETQLRALGAAELIDTDRQRLDAGSRIVDAVLDLVGGELRGQAWPHVRAGGAFASVLGMPDEQEADRRGVRAIAVHTLTDPAQLTEIAGLVVSGAITVVVSQTLHLEQARRAHEMLQRGGVGGKIVLAVP